MLEHYILLKMVCSVLVIFRFLLIKVIEILYNTDKSNLRIDKPRKKPTFQMIGGKVEDGESIRDAAIRECHEELGEKAIFDENLFEFVMDFEEIATSDPTKRIHMNIFQYKGQLKGELTVSEEKVIKI